MKKWILSVLLLLALVLGVEATTHQLNVNPYVDGRNVLISLDGHARYVYAGQFNVSFVGTPHEGYAQSWETYCTDLNEVLWSQGNTWTVVEGQSAPQADLSSTHWVLNGWNAASDVYLTYRDDPNVGGTPLQLAIWSAIYGERFHVLDSTYTGTVASLLAGTRNYDVSDWWMPSTTDGNYSPGQGMIGNTVAVPESGNTGFLMALSLCLPLALGWRKMRPA